MQIKLGNYRSGIPETGAPGDQNRGSVVIRNTGGQDTECPKQKVVDFEEVVAYSGGRLLHHPGLSCRHQNIFTCGARSVNVEFFLQAVKPPGTPCVWILKPARLYRPSVMLLPFRQSSNLTRLQRVITSEIMKVLLQKIILGSVLSVYWYGRPLDWKSHHWDNGLFGETFTDMRIFWDMN